MFQSYRYRIYPNEEQSRKFAINFGCVRVIYNRLVELSEQMPGEVLTSRSHEQNLIQTFKQDEPWLNEVQQSVIFHAFDKLKLSLEHSKRMNRKLRFKQATSKQTFCLTNYRNAIQIYEKHIGIQSIGMIRTRMSHLPEGQIINSTIIKSRSGRFYISVLVKKPDDALTKDQLAKKTSITCIGLDVGIKHFLTRSDGQKIDNPQHFEKSYERLRRAQKILSRKQKGSNNYQAQCLKLARIHEHIDNQRHGFLHRLSTELVKQYDLIAVETIAISELMAQKILSRQISDAAWRTFINMLIYKANWYSKEVIQIDRYFASSKTCCKCRHKMEELPMNIREWTCPACTTKHDRDINAAINIMIQGARLYKKKYPERTQQQLIPIISDLR